MVKYNLNYKELNINYDRTRNQLSIRNNNKHTIYKPNSNKSNSQFGMDYSVPGTLGGLGQSYVSPSFSSKR